MRIFVVQQLIGRYSALKGMVLGEGTETDDPVQAVKDVYAQGGSKDTDEFLKPIVVGGKERRLQGMNRATSRSGLVETNVWQTTTLSSSSTTDLVSLLFILVQAWVSLITVRPCPPNHPSPRRC